MWKSYSTKPHLIDLYTYAFCLKLRKKHDQLITWIIEPNKHYITIHLFYKWEIHFDEQLILTCILIYRVRFIQWFFACSQWQVTGVLLQLWPLTCTHKPNLAQECQSLLKDLRVTFSVERQRSAVADFAAALILFSSSLSWPHFLFFFFTLTCTILKIGLKQISMRNQNNITPKHIFIFWITKTTTLFS